MQIKSDHPGTLPEPILSVLERYWGFSLPKEYRNFLLEHNGGEPNVDCFNFKNDKEDGSDIRCFLGIYPDQHNDLLDHIKTYKDRLPSNLFPIAYDSCSNLICISVTEPDRGKIYFWDHEVEADPSQDEVPDYSNLTLIADSFNEFLEGLYSNDETA